MKKVNKPTSKKVQDLEKDMKCPIDHTMTTNDVRFWYTCL